MRCEIKTQLMRNIIYSLLVDNMRFVQHSTALNTNSKKKFKANTNREKNITERYKRKRPKKTAERLVRWKCNRDEILFWSDRIRTLSTRINDQTQLFNFSVGIVWCFTRILVFLLFFFDSLLFVEFRCIWSLIVLTNTMSRSIHESHRKKIYHTRNTPSGSLLFPCA